MITENENLSGLYAREQMNVITHYNRNYTDDMPTERSCFYEFGVQRGAKFSGYTNERSSFVENAAENFERALKESVK